MESDKQERVFIIPLHLVGLEGSDMPEEYLGAFVNSYIKSNNIEVAIDILLADLNKRKMALKEDVEEVYTLDGPWETHVHEKWPALQSYLPNKEEFHRELNLDKVVYGPFGGYTEAASAD